MTREEFVALVSKLGRGLEEGGPHWENAALPAYLDALAAWVADSPGYYANRGEPVPSVDWQVFADALQAARSYE